RAHPPPTLLPSKPPKRKRATEQQLKKPPRTSCPGPSVQDVDSVTYWTQTYHWPREYFNESGEISHLLARKKSTTSLRRKRSDSESGAPSSTTPSDQKPREEKSAPYQDPRYRSLLEAKGSFMGKYVGRNEEGPTAESKKEYKSLLEAEQVVAEHSLFQNDFFEDTCEMIQDRNEAKVIQDIARLIVPSAQSLAVRGAKHLRCLIESVNEGWNNSIPVPKHDLNQITLWVSNVLHLRTTNSRNFSRLWAISPTSPSSWGHGTCTSPSSRAKRSAVRPHSTWQIDRTRTA
ncbi:hypothetical protein LTR93_012035, partial [Exophiala xenobiotica]